LGGAAPPPGAASSASSKIELKIPAVTGFPHQGF
jgi:hypothetical protein